MSPNNNLICGALYGKTSSEIIQQTATLEDLVDLFEIRLDLMEFPDISGCINQITKPLLFTNRPKWEGGKYQGNETDRIAALHEAINLGAAYIDIELKTDSKLRKNLITTAKNSKTKVVVSSHDFKKTPQADNLENTLSQMIQSGADIGKIITTANTPADSARILALLDKARDKGFPLTTFAMGEHGRISRFATLFLGGCMSYVAANEAQATAPGQFTAQQLIELILLFKKSHEH